MISLTALFFAASIVVSTQSDCRRGFDAPDLIIDRAVSSAAYGDFDEDGHVDVAYMDQSQFNVALNRGGVFEPQPFPNLDSLLQQLRIVAASDIDHDGHLDLIFRATNTYGVAFGDGHGRFGRAVVSRPFNDIDLFAGDINHDGVLDFIDYSLSRHGTFYVVLGSREGTYAGTVISLFNGNGPVVAGDFDGDGFVDVAVVDRAPGGGWIIRYGWGTGDPSKFVVTTATLSGPSALPSYFSAVDLDGDGVSEIVTSATDVFYVIRAGKRQPVLTSTSVPGAPTFGINRGFAADLNGDGLPDLVSDSVMLALGDGRMTSPVYYALPGTSGWTAVDIDGDGLPDVVPSGGYEGLPVLYGRTVRSGIGGGVRFMPTESVPMRHAEIADVNRDGIDDVLMVDDSPGANAFVLFGDGAGAFRHGAAIPAPGSNTLFTNLAVGDFDGDGSVDLAMSAGAGTAIVRFGNGAGDFGAPMTIDADTIVGRLRLGSAAPPALLADRGGALMVVTISAGRIIQISPIVGAPAGGAVVVDADRDGIDDIVVNDAGGRLHLLRGPSPWKEVALFGTANQFRIFGIFAADMDGDGRTDLVIQNGSTSFIAYAQPDGTYSVVQIFGVMTITAVADIDGDGRPDILSVKEQNSGYPAALVINRNLGGGTFEAYSKTMINQAYGHSLVVDADRDGWPDLVVPSAGGVQVLHNTFAQSPFRRWLPRVSA
jgi:hypothetical protein